MGSVVPPLLTAEAVRFVPEGCICGDTWQPDNAGKTERVTSSNSLRFSPGRLGSELQLISSEYAFQRSFDPAYLSVSFCQFTLLFHSLSISNVIIYEEVEMSRVENLYNVTTIFWH
jgi:hypothetical protein